MGRHLSNTCPFSPEVKPAFSFPFLSFPIYACTPCAYVSHWCRIATPRGTLAFPCLALFQRWYGTSTSTHLPTREVKLCQFCPDANASLNMNCNLMWTYLWTWTLDFWNEWKYPFWVCCDNPWINQTMCINHAQRKSLRVPLMASWCETLGSKSLEKRLEFNYPPIHPLSHPHCPRMEEESEFE